MASEPLFAMVFGITNMPITWGTTKKH